ncbi:MAG: hypothetical protein LC802_04170 [Acidobacteria bacterium]|nr:hypothetical protein [Acidobacteriota bacterium]
MRFEISTLKRTISALAVVVMLVFGASADAWAHVKHGKKHKQNQGRHLGWERGRRVGQHRRDDNNWNQRRRQARRHWRDERSDLRRHQRSERGTFDGSRRDLKSHQKGERRVLKAHQRAERKQLKH